MTSRSSRDASDSRKGRRRQINRSIARTTRELVALVCQHIDAGGRVSSNLAARILIDDTYIGVSFTDYPGDYAPIVEWRKR